MPPELGSAVYEGYGEDNDTLMRRVRETTREIVSATQPTFLNITVNRICSEIPWGADDNPTVLEEVVKAVFDMVSDDTIDDNSEDLSKHARCGETYADLLYVMGTALPECRVPGNDKPVTLKTILLNITQDTFEFVTKKFTDPTVPMTDVDMHRILAVVSFIGHIYIRRLVAARVVAQVVHDLIGVKDIHPRHEYIRCVCELMLLIGKTIDSSKQGNMLMTQFLARLSNLTVLKKEFTNEPVYPEEIKDVIMGVHEARCNQWPPRAGTQVLAQFQLVSREDALANFKQLYHKGALPFTVTSENPVDIQDASPDLKDVKIVSFISGSCIGQLFSRSFTADMTASKLAQDISAQTSIHSERLMLFSPDSKLRKDDEIALPDA